MKTSMKTAEVFAALAKASAKLENPIASAKADVPTKSGGRYSYTYAPLDEILAAVRATLSEYGLAAPQNATSADGLVMVETWLIHESGQWMAFGPLAIPTGAGAQEHGSALTYARRYALMTALGLAADDDDDGAGAQRVGSRRPKGEKQPGDGDLLAGERCQTRRNRDGVQCTEIGPHLKHVFPRPGASRGREAHSTLGSTASGSLPPSQDPAPASGTNVERDAVHGEGAAPVPDTSGTAVGGITPLPRDEPDAAAAVPDALGHTFVGAGLICERCGYAEEAHE